MNQPCQQTLTNSFINSNMGGDNPNSKNAPHGVTPSAAHYGLLHSQLSESAAIAQLKEQHQREMEQLILQYTINPTPPMKQQCSQQQPQFTKPVSQNKRHRPSTPPETGLATPCIQRHINPPLLKQGVLKDDDDNTNHDGDNLNNQPLPNNHQHDNNGNNDEDTCNNSSLQNELATHPYRSLYTQCLTGMSAGNHGGNKNSSLSPVAGVHTTTSQLMPPTDNKFLSAFSNDTGL
jgi:hypothetical protein